GLATLGVVHAPPGPRPREPRMDRPAATAFQHPVFTRRTALQAGAVGLLGLGVEHVAALRAAQPTIKPVRSVIYVFLSGGLAQQDSCHMKPDAPPEIHAHSNPTPTPTPGNRISPPLPRLPEHTPRRPLAG